MKTASKCLARMTGCSDPEFEPSVEEIVEYRCHMAILSVFAFFGKLALGGDFPIQSSTRQWRSHSGVNRLKPRAPIYMCTEHAQFVDVSFMAATFTRDSGCSLSCSSYPQ